MARRVIYKQNGLSGNPPEGYKYVGFDGNTFSEITGTALSLIGGISGNRYKYINGNGSTLENAQDIINAYDYAKNLSLSDTERYTIIVGPGEYGFNSTFILDTNYIDIVSLSGNPDVVFNREDLTDPFDYDTDTFDVTEKGVVLGVSASDVYIKGIKTKQRLSLKFDEWQGDVNYFIPMDVDSNLPNVVFENCIGGYFSFGDSTINRNINSKFFNCKSKDYSFGYIASGTFIDCEGGFDSFGSSVSSGYFERCKSTSGAFSRTGVASGTFINCEGNSGSFGGISGIASGTFKNCKGGINSFGRSGTLTVAEASGLFINCESSSSSFGSGNCLVSGTFITCKGSNNCFGEGRDSLISGRFYNCIATTNAFGGGGSNITSTAFFINCEGALRSFGGNSNTSLTTATVSGTFINCVGANNSFGGKSNTGAGTLTIDGYFKGCKAGDYSFGGIEGTNASNIVSGTFIDCQGGNYSFGGRRLGTSTVSGKFTNCIASNNGFGKNGTLTGQLYYCRIETPGASGQFQGVTASGRTVYCIDGDNNTNNQ
jgi:hypothetical protein